MKFLFLAALILSSAHAFAQAMPSGRVIMTIIKTEILLNNDKYEFKSDVLCKINIPVTVLDTRADNMQPVRSDNSCKFVHHGKDYFVDAYYGAYVTNKSVVPAMPKEDLLQFMAGFQTTTSSAKNDFHPSDFTSFTTKDFNVKSVILEVFPKIERHTCVPGLGCSPKIQTYLEAVYEYELN